MTERLKRPRRAHTWSGTTIRVEEQRARSGGVAVQIYCSGCAAIVEIWADKLEPVTALQEALRQHTCTER